MGTRRSYAVRCGKRLVSLQKAATAREAVIEYLNSMGCRDSEISPVSATALSWGGAVYRADVHDAEEELSTPAGQYGRNRERALW